MAKNRPNVVLLIGSLFAFCTLFAAGPAFAADADAKKTKSKTQQPAAAQKQQKQQKKEPAATRAGAPARPQGQAAHDHKGHDHKGHDHAAHGPGKGHPGHGHGGPARPPHMGSHKEGFNQGKDRQIIAYAKALTGPVVDEQRKHAERKAKLTRLIKIAQQTLNLEMAKLIHKLVEKETKRHYKVMAEMRKTMRYQAQAITFPMNVGGPKR